MSPDLLTGCITGRTRAMATDVTVHLVADPGREADAAVAAALDVFREVEAACTRFDDRSPLMQANARPGQWSTVPSRCARAVEEAYRAYRATDGRFDPRILADLVALGYTTTLPFAAGDVDVGGPPARRRLSLPPWQPRFRVRRGEHQVHLGGLPLDLGGIGKGLAVRWAAEALAGTRQRPGAPSARGFLVEAGGDCMAAGHAPDGGPWRVGVEDPAGAPEPVAVLGLVDLACTTSSTRLRRWTAGGRPVHHLIDPRTGLPGGHGLRSVTVAGPDPAMAEVWGKTLFLAGACRIGALADRHRLAACWTTDGGGFAWSAAMAPQIVWRR